MLGYLRLKGRRPELDGLQVDMTNTYRDTTGKFPRYDGLSFGVHELLDTRMTKRRDPDPVGGRQRLPGPPPARRARGLVRRPFPAAASRGHVHPTGRGGEAAEHLVDRPELRRPPHRAHAPDLPPSSDDHPPSDVTLGLGSLVYWVLRRLLELVVLRLRSERSKELEILVLRHQLHVVRRQVTRPRLRPVDRVLLAAFSRSLPRPAWTSFFVSPVTLLRWHRQ